MHKKQKTEHTHQQPKADLSSGVGAEETKDSHRDGHKGNQSEQRKEWFWGLTRFEVIMAVLTVLAIAVAAINAGIYKGQLHALKSDQRAWIKFEHGGARYPEDTGGPEHFPRFSQIGNMSAGQPLIVPVRFINTGKTPARNFDAIEFVEIVNTEHGPTLSQVDGTYNRPHTHFTAGILFPSVAADNQVVRLQDRGQPKPITIDEAKAFDEGIAYIAVYGIVTYDDIFNTHRWTKFCEFLAPRRGVANAMECTQFNSVDDN